MHMQPPEKIIVQKKTIGCDGGDEPLGHPMVYLTMDSATNSVDCPYCGRHFVLDPKAKAHAGGH